MDDSAATGMTVTRHSADDQIRVQRERLQQGIIDAEIRASRRQILTGFRDRLRTDPATLSAPDFLALADQQTIHQAIIATARGIARPQGCHLQIYDPSTRCLRIVRHHGLPPALLHHFAAVTTKVASACAVALDTGDPVLIDDITRSPIFAGQPTLDVMLAAGTRAVHSYPLHDDHGTVLGVLSLHFHTAVRHPGQELLAWHAARALSHVAALQDRPATHTDLATTETDAGLTTVTPRGPLDAFTAPGFTEHMHHTLATLTAGHTVLIDLRKLEFLAVAGARALIRADELCRARGIGCYLLAGAGDDAGTVLTSLDVPDGLRIVEDISQITLGRGHDRP